MENVALRVEVERKYRSIQPKVVKVEKLGILRRIHRFFDLEGARLSDCIIYYGAILFVLSAGITAVWGLLNV